MTRKSSYSRLFDMIFLVFIYLNLSNAAWGQNQVQQDWDNIDYHSLRIPSFDGTELASVLLLPNEQNFPGLRPAIIFVNSWTLTEHEYLWEARKFARQGYIVLSYATRGFSSSGGKISVAGPADLADVTSVIDWLEAHSRVDIGRIGMAGVSYGAGIALLAAAHDSRVMSVAAMSGWGNLEQAIYGNDTIRKVWLDILVGSATLFGRLDPDIQVQLKRLQSNTDIEKVRAWAALRSPLSYVAKINERKIPILIANSYQDGLFPPEQIRSFYEQLEGPKAFFLDNGIHGSSALPGLFGLPSPIWKEVHQWFDTWLKPRSRVKELHQPISFQTDRGREYFSQFPGLISNQENMILKPINNIKRSNSNYEFEEVPDRVSFESGSDSGATTGIPLFSEIGEAILGRRVEKNISLINRRFAAIYATETQTKKLFLRGSPAIRLWLAPHRNTVQLIAYLYDRDAFGKGKLITHGVYAQRSGTTEISELNFNLNIASYDMPAGHRFVLVIDSQDPLYKDYKSGQSSIELIQEGERVTSMALPLAP